MLALLRIKGFVAFVGIAFINAFIDLGHKIIVQNTLFKSFDGSEQIILTAIVNALILLPFVLLFSPAGYLSDRFSKPSVMRWSARIAVVITLLITLSYYQGWFEVAFAMTLFLALQSALYSPAKYGFIRELVGVDDLAAGNAWIQSVTMVAILSGIVVFSLLFETLLFEPVLSGLLVTGADPATILQYIAPLGWVLVAAAILEAGLTQCLSNQHAPCTEVSFDWSAYRSAQLLKQNLGLIIHCKPIIQSIVGLSVFWTISQIMLAVFPSFAEVALQEHNTFVIQGAMALAGIGIMLGAVVVAKLSPQRINRGLIPVGAVGVALGVILLPYVSSLAWAAADFLLIGVSGALMTIPLNALVQLHAPQDKMGKVLAGNNFIQNIAMLAGLILTVIFSLLQWSETWLLYGLGVLALFGVIQTYPVYRKYR